MLAILGGTFNPIHQTHVALAQAVHTQIPEVEVRLMPNALPPHRASPGVSAEHRLAMCRLAIADIPYLCVDDFEIKQKNASYTINSLIHYRSLIGKERPLAWILGADAYAQLTSWHRYAELRHYAHFIICVRPGSLSPKGLSPLNALSKQAAGLFAEFAFTPSETSATQIRAQLAKGETLSSEVLHPQVAQYIKDHHLYG